MDACFQRLEELFVAHSKRNEIKDPFLSMGCMHSVGVTGTTSNDHGRINIDEDHNGDTLLLRYALEFFYLWVTFAPLSRGT